MAAKESDQKTDADNTNINNDNNNDKNQEKNGKELIVISGITSGIGCGMLREFMKLGFIVAGFGRRKENIDALKKELKINDDILLTCIDICNTDDVLKWSNVLIAKYGAPRLCIHNAGSVVGCNKNTWEIDMKLLNTSFQIHIGGSVIMSKAFIPSMQKNPKNKQGVFINISSWAGKNGYAEGTPYCVSKFGLEGLTQCLAQELSDTSPEMCACCVSPGFVNTSMLKGSFAEQGAKQKDVENGDAWAIKCCPWLLTLNAKHNGKSLGPPLEKDSMKKYCDFFKQWGVEMKYENYIHPSE